MRQWKRARQRAPGIGCWKGVFLADGSVRSGGAAGKKDRQTRAVMRLDGGRTGRVGNSVAAPGGDGYLTYTQPIILPNRPEYL